MCNVNRRGYFSFWLMCGILYYFLKWINGKIDDNFCLFYLQGFGCQIWKFVIYLFVFKFKKNYKNGYLRNVMQDLNKIYY